MYLVYHQLLPILYILGIIFKTLKGIIISGINNS